MATMRERRSAPQAIRVRLLAPGRLSRPSTATAWTCPLTADPLAPAPTSSETPTGPDEHNRIGVGIASIIIAVFCFSIGDAIGKYLGHAGYAAFQIVFFRYLFGLLPALIFVWHSGIGSLRTRRPHLHLLRAGLLFSALSSFFAAIKAMPLAEAVAIAFTAPLFITALSQPLLGEPVGARRWAAVLFGFGGALIALRPGTEAFRQESLLVLLAALCFALAMLLTRRMSRTETNAAMLTYSTGGACLISSPFMIMVWQPTEPVHLAILVGLGCIGGCAAYFMIRAYRHAPAAVIAPFEYTGLIWAAIIGWIVWRDQPHPAVWAGAALIAAAGVYIAQREAAVRRRELAATG